GPGRYVVRVCGDDGRDVRVVADVEQFQLTDHRSRPRGVLELVAGAVLVSQFPAAPAGSPPTQARRSVAAFVCVAMDAMPCWAWLPELGCEVGCVLARDVLRQ